MLNSVTVPVKSAIASKINWLQVITLLITALTGLTSALNLDPATAAKVTAAVAMAGQVATMVLRTFFTNSVVSNSVKGN